MWASPEEGMEMLGVIVLIYALLDHVRGSRSREVRVEVGLEMETSTSAEL